MFDLSRPFCSVISYIMTAVTYPDTVNGIFSEMLSLSGRTAAENIANASGIFLEILL
jgi:hypothetical protein